MKRLPPAVYSTPPPRNPLTHALKVWPQFFDDMATGKKPFDVRLFDRDFKVGDTLLFREFQPRAEKFTGRSVCRRISYMFFNCPEFGLMDGFVLLGLEPLEIVHAMPAPHVVALAS